MSRPILLGWIDTALRLDRENAELRRICTSLLFWIAENGALLELAREEAAARWPSEEESAA